jgi:hypothetical protein
MVETFIKKIATLLITLYGLTNRLLAIFRVIEVGLPILNIKYFIVGIVITLTLIPSSTKTSHNTNPLHCTLMIGSHSRSTIMAFKGVGAFKTLSLNNLSRSTIMSFKGVDTFKNLNVNNLSLIPFKQMAPFAPTVQW